MTEEKSKRSLDINWEEVFPGTEVEVVGKKIKIKPMGIELLADVASRLRGMGKQLSEAGVNWGNYDSVSSLPSIAAIVLKECPDVISDAANIALKDIRRLPLEEIIPLIQAILEINLKSRETLEKNFQSLAATLQKISGVEKDQSET